MLSRPAISTLPAARQAYHDYLAFMRNHPWAKGAEWNATLEVVKGYCQYVEEDPPNLKACGTLWLAMEKGDGGSSVLLDSCPELEPFGLMKEAAAWLYHFKNDASHHQPLSVAQREDIWAKADKRRMAAITARNSPPQAGASFPNTPEGWAQMESRMKLPPGTLTKRQKPGQSGPFIVVEKQADGSEKFSVRKKFPGRIVKLDGPWWRQLWFKISGR